MERVFSAHGIAIDEFVIGDVTDATVVERLLHGCDAVFHAAAVVAFEAARASEVRATNQRSVETVLSVAARERLRRIVYVSSAGALFTPGGPPIHGDSPIGRATTAYGESKARAERFARKLQDDGVPILTVYPTGVIGPDDPGLTEPNRALQIMLDLIAPMTTSGYQPVDVRDLAAMNVALIESKLASGRYVAAGRYYPWSELFDRIEALTGRKLRRVRTPAPLLRAAGVAADVLKHFVSFSLPLTRETMEYATRWQTVDAAATERDLGIRFREVDDSLTDTLRWMVRAGHLRSEQIGRLAE
jgi:nucleoside-diphosphate-sugar epimerase